VKERSVPDLSLACRCITPISAFVFTYCSVFVQISSSFKDVSHTGLEAQDTPERRHPNLTNYVQSDYFQIKSHSEVLEVRTSAYELTGAQLNLLQMVSLTKSWLCEVLKVQTLLLWGQVLLSPMFGIASFIWLCPCCWPTGTCNLFCVPDGVSQSPLPLWQAQSLTQLDAVSEIPI
jgi:hypothetical protein